MAQTVVAFVGENANGILDCQARRFLELLGPMGFEGQVLSVAEPGFVQRLDHVLEAGVAFAWGYAGIGARLAAQGRNLWDALGVPFVSVLADAPYIMPRNHHVPTPWVVNGYVYRDWLDMQVAHFGSPQVSTMLPHGVVPNPGRHALAWSARPNRMVFVKTGGDPDSHRARWALWPARLQPVLHDSAAALSVAEPQPILPVVQACLAAHGLVLDGCKPLLFGLLHELDTFLRALRATAMARAMLPLPVDIVGDGWEHLRDGSGRARFHAAVPAGDLDALYAETKVLVNVTPNLATAPHERVLRGFGARCRVLSDDAAGPRAALSGLPSYHGVDWHAPDLADQVAAVFHDPTPFDERLDAAEAYVAERHDPAVFLQALVDAAQLARVHTKLSVYALDAA